MEKTKDKPNFEEKKEILLMERFNIDLKHKHKMEELERERQNMITFHNNELERIRIKSAEIRKSAERKADMRFMSDYAKDSHRTSYQP